MQVRPSMAPSSYGGTELDVFQHAIRWKAYFASTLRRYVVGDVLEVGAGLGGTSRFLCDGRQRSWTCLEPDPALLRQLEASLAAQPLPSPVRALCGNTDVLRRDERFDTILYVDVLEHIDDDSAELAKSATHLRSGGHIIVLAPAHQALYSEFDKAIGHFRRYSKASLIAAAPAVLQLVEAYYLDAVGMAASLTNRLLLRASAPTHGQIKFWDRVLVPVSRVIDPVLARSVGKSVVGIWTRSPQAAKA